MRGSQNPEAQQRIDSVLKQLAGKATDPAKPPAAGTGAAPPPDAPQAPAPVQPQVLPQGRIQIEDAPVQLQERG
jgi:hypothetical protein